MSKRSKDMIKRYIKFIIAHFALYCNSAFRSDLYFLKLQKKRGEPMKFTANSGSENRR